jgi:hypothetical protein
MALKGFTVTTGLVKDHEDMASGFIGEITQETITRATQSKRGEIDEVTSEVFTVPVLCQSTNDKPLKINLMLGTKINPEPLDTIRRGSKNVKVYNKLTTFLLNTGCLAESDLENVIGKESEIFNRFQSLQGVKIRFKTEKIKSGFNDILISSIKIDGETKTEPVKK